MERDRAASDATIERIGAELEVAIQRRIAMKGRRSRAYRVAAAVLVPAAVAVVGFGAYGLTTHRGTEPVREGSPAIAVDGAVAVSNRIAIFPVITPSGVRSDCYRVETEDGRSRLRCPKGEAARFATHAFIGAHGLTLYGRAALPGAARVVLQFPGRRRYAVDLQRAGYWAWDSPTPELSRARAGLVIVAVAADGRVLARDRHPAASRTV